MKIKLILEDVTKQEIAKILHRDDISFASDFARIKAALWIYKFQTEDEQKLGQTIHKNFVGFMGHGSLKISTVCKKLLDHYELTPDDIILVRDSIQKYAGQMAKLINQGLIQKGDNKIETAINSWAANHKKYYTLRSEQEKYILDMIQKYSEIENINKKYKVIPLKIFADQLKVYGWYIWDSDLLTTLWKKYYPIITLNPYKSKNRFDDTHLQKIKEGINKILDEFNDYKNTINKEYLFLQRLTAILLPGQTSYTERYKNLVKSFKFIDSTPYKIDVTFIDNSILTYDKIEVDTFQITYLGTSYTFSIYSVYDNAMTDTEIKSIAKNASVITKLLTDRFSSTIEQYLKIIDYLVWVYNNKQKWYMKYKKDELMDLYHKMNGNDKLKAKEYYLSKAPEEYRNDLDF